MHLNFFLYSCVGVISKLTSKYETVSKPFLIGYIIIIVGLLVYAIIWQQILKNISLSVATINKTITLIWGMLWGRLIFSEPITLFKIIGTTLVLFGLSIILKGEN